MLKTDELKKQLDKYQLQYEREEFIKNDPVQFVHRFREKQDIEIAGFITSIFSYGKREAFIIKLNHIFELMGNKPFQYMKTGNFENLTDCDYRFSKNIDFLQMCKILNDIYKQDETLESLFKYSYNETGDIWGMFQGVCDYFYSKISLEVTKGFYHLLPNPAKKSALKRMNMLMRWFIRKSCVDIGIWDFMPKSELLIPLDTHVAKISRKLGILSRTDNSYGSVMEITSVLKQFDPDDPIKYDFALFGYGVNNK